jgi:histidyl-tRNA synthetase
MPSTTPGRPPGFYDRTTQEAAEAGAVTAQLQHVLARFGYLVVETPLIEYADLFLTKSGDEAINRLFNFEMYGRQLCLRSEFTASAARLYIERYQHELKPIRWQFAGPIFRYESPQRSHSRQFTMVGTELIGPSGVGGDAEAMALAVRGLLAVGLTNWTLVVGHVGLVGQLLDRFDLDRRTRRLVLGQIENLRRLDRGRAYVEEQFERLYAGLPQQLERLEEVQVAAIAETHGDVSRALELLLESANLGTTGTGRTNEDVARRLLNKQRRANQRGEVMRALDFLQNLIAIEGPPDAAFAQLDAMLPDDAAIHDTARSFRAAVELLSAYDVKPEQVSLQMGLARGLNYYTGVVFEAHTRVGDSASQLCGGGRYDDFMRVLGASQDTPAIGFAYGVERILHELRRTGYEVPPPGVRALVVPVEEADNAEAARTAMLLRKHAAVELYTPPTRNLSQTLALAARRGTPYVIIIGAEERKGRYLSVRDMRAGEQFICPMNDMQDDLIEKLTHDR